MHCARVKWLSELCSSSGHTTTSDFWVLNTLKKKREGQRLIKKMLQTISAQTLCY